MVERHKPSGGSRKAVQLVNVTDFTGGLNKRADAFQLAPNESPELLNVDIDPRGGFRRRRGINPFATTGTADAHSIGTYETTGGNKSVIIGVGNTVLRSTGGVFTSFATRTVTDRIRMVTFKDNLYVQNGVDAPFGYDGSVVTPLTQVYNDTIASPTSGNMPIAKCIAVWQGSVWVANTTEGGTAYRNRVRFSHPNFPECYRSFDFFDVDTGVDGDYITALVPYGDRMLVFKRKSVHAIYGSGPDGFSIAPVDSKVGAISQEAVIATEAGIYCFSWPNGVMRFDGRGFENVFRQLSPLIEDSTIPDAYQDKITLGWGNQRLWVSVPYEGSSTANRVFVLDPSLGKRGSWTEYDLAIGPFVVWNPPGSDVMFLGAALGKLHIVKLDDSGDGDNYGTGTVPINSSYTSRWYDAGNPAVRKRWRRPEVVLRSGTNSETNVEVMLDYDPSETTRSFKLRTHTDPVGVFIWDEGTWDGETSLWGRDTTNRNEVVRGRAFGNGRAVALRFTAPNAVVPWAVDSVSLKYVNKPIR